MFYTTRIFIDWFFEFNIIIRDCVICVCCLRSFFSQPLTYLYSVSHMRVHYYDSLTFKSTLAKIMFGCMETNNNNIVGINISQQIWMLITSLVWDKDEDADDVRCDARSARFYRFFIQDTMNLLPFDWNFVSFFFHCYRYAWAMSAQGGSTTGAPSMGGRATPVSGGYPEPHNQDAVATLNGEQSTQFFCEWNHASSY
jgi:hypothetical protein